PGTDSSGSPGSPPAEDYFGLAGGLMQRVPPPHSAPGGGRLDAAPAPRGPPRPPPCPAAEREGGARGGGGLLGVLGALVVVPGVAVWWLSSGMRRLRSTDRPDHSSPSSALPAVTGRPPTTVRRAGQGPGDHQPASVSGADRQPGDPAAADTETSTGAHLGP